MKQLLKSAREKKGLLTREIAQKLGIDQALVSKFETGARKPTKAQVVKLAQILDIPIQTLMVAWLKEKIIYELADEEYAIDALKAAEAEIKISKVPNKQLVVSKDLAVILKEIDKLKNQLDAIRQFDKACP